MISRRDLASVIAQKTLHLKTSKRLAQSVAAYLIQEKRSGELELVMRDVIATRDKAGTIEVIATSVDHLDEGLRAQINNIVQKHYPVAEHIIIDERHDPAIIGGLILEFAGRRLDMSVRSKLNQLKRFNQSSPRENAV